MTRLSDLAASLERGDSAAVAELTQQAIDAGLGAQTILDDGLIAGMAVVGRKFKAHEIFLPDVLLAAHDIGALGYFGRRDILDMAGLVSPDVIPFIRDERALALHLDQNQVDLLVTFPGWYPELVRGREALYQTQGSISRELGGENMAVYRWNP